jgi:hypothetical protein
MNKHKITENVSTILFALVGLFLSNFLIDYPVVTGAILGISILVFMYKLFMVPQERRGKIRKIEFNYASFSVVADMITIIVIGMITNLAAHQIFNLIEFLLDLLSN